ncbi:MAG: spore cortex biosynthesis protein YabQ [Oscillospiraceae bacterium]|nr:spore cortex biosynthesis protein YabQ [Oscillospiraceae bacterium]MBQ9907107.1 spore cortex biosynthesis protein YabQ [Oscillospiraceae bacterium]
MIASLGHLTVAEELLRFLRSILLGLPAGILLDLFRTLRILLPHHPAAVFLEDALYAFALCFFLQCYAWMYADTVFRWPYAAGEILGLAAYMLTVGAVWMRMLRRIRCRISRIRSFFCRAVSGRNESGAKSKKISESP